MRPGNHPQPLPRNLPVPLDFDTLSAQSFGESVPPDSGLATSDLVFDQSFLAYSNHALTPFDLTPAAYRFPTCCHARRIERDFYSYIKDSLRVLDVTRLFQALFLGASPRFHRPEGSEAVLLRLGCRYMVSSGHLSPSTYQSPRRPFILSASHPILGRL